MKATQNTSGFLVNADKGTVTVPAGRYYLCDPCYAVRDDQWNAWLDSLDHDAGGIAYGVTADGHPVFGFSTAYGDGSWVGSDGVLYYADAGMIGLVPVAHNETANDARSFFQLRVVEFSRPTTCRRSARGILTFGGVRVNTAR
jgi:hypothetical protein